MQSFKPIMRETVLDVKHCRNQVYLLLLMMLELDGQFCQYSQFQRHLSYFSTKLFLGCRDCQYFKYMYFKYIFEIQNTILYLNISEKKLMYFVFNTFNLRMLYFIRPLC